LELRGTIERVTFQSSDKTFTVARFLPEDKGAEPLTVVGNLGGIAVGESVELEGQFEEHPTHGRQFRVSRATPRLPVTRRGIEKYLASDLVPDVGPALASRLYKHFGADVLRIAEEHPERLTEVPGIGPKRAAAIAQALKGRRRLGEAMSFLAECGLSPGLATAVLRRYGDAAIATVRAHPYRLVRDIPGIGFLTADKMAQQLGIPRTSSERIGAGVLYALSKAEEDEGHCFLPASEVVARTSNLLDVEPALVEAALPSMESKGAITVEVWGGERHVYSPRLYRAEVGLAKALARLKRAGLSWAARPRLGARAEGLSAGQRRAVEVALREPVVVLTGGPGTGKTTCIRALVASCEEAGLRVALCAPTGRAAKRLSEATGRPGRTVHRLLEYLPDGHFGRTQHRPLSADLIVCDESSMLDVSLAQALIEAVPQGAGLLLCGDVHQLPSVGPGNVLADIIRSERFPVAELTEIFRQASGSSIVTNAHRVHRGEFPRGKDSDTGVSDFHFVRCEEALRARDIVVRLVAERIPQAFGLHPTRDVQVLTPMHRGDAGTVGLNAALQAALNPPAANRGEIRLRSRVLRVGDRVVQTRNDYERDVFNGDLGEIVSVTPGGDVTVDFDGRRVTYAPEHLPALEHAFAISVHKAQGSEYPAVVLVLLTEHWVMLERSLLYTAITRAKRLMVIVVSERALRRAVQNVEMPKRYTRLAERLRSEGGERKT